MLKVLLIDQDNFSYNDLEQKPLAGTMSGFIQLVRAFEKLNCKVIVRTSSDEEYTNELVEWKKLGTKIKEKDVDLFIVNRFPKLFSYFPKGKNKVLWMRNEGGYLYRWKHAKLMLRYWPKLAFTSYYHKGTYASFMPGGKRLVIPHGLDSDLISSINTDTDRQLKVAFTSNPLRSLDWLVDLWIKEIHPKVPEAELHVFSSHKTYGKWGEKVKHLMIPVLEKVKSAKGANVILRDPLPKKDLLNELSHYRAMFYRGDKAETFCFAVAEAQAMGLPCVVQDRGSMSERVVDGETGFIEDDDSRFAKRCVDILTDDQLFRRLSANAMAEAEKLSWANTAKEFINKGISNA